MPVKPEKLLAIFTAILILLLCGLEMFFFATKAQATEASYLAAAAGTYVVGGDGWGSSYSLNANGFTLNVGTAPWGSGLARSITMTFGTSDSAPNPCNAKIRIDYGADGASWNATSAQWVTFVHGTEYNLTYPFGAGPWATTDFAYIKPIYVEGDCGQANVYFSVDETGDHGPSEWNQVPPSPANDVADAWFQIDTEGSLIPNIGTGNPVGGGGGGSWGETVETVSDQWPTKPTCTIWGFTWSVGSTGTGLTCVMEWVSWLIIPPSSVTWNYLSEPFEMLSSRWPFYYLTGFVSHVTAGLATNVSCPFPDLPTNASFLNANLPTPDICGWFEVFQTPVENDSVSKALLVLLVYIGFAVALIELSRRFLIH